MSLTQEQKEEILSIKAPQYSAKTEIEIKLEEALYNILRTVNWSNSIPALEKETIVGFCEEALK